MSPSILKSQTPDTSPKKGGSSSTETVQRDPRHGDSPLPFRRVPCPSICVEADRAAHHAPVKHKRMAFRTNASRFTVFEHKVSLMGAGRTMEAGTVIFENMPPTALSILRGQSSSEHVGAVPSSNILGTSDSFKMGRVHTTSIPAKVVDLKAGGDGAFFQGVADTVGIEQLPAHHHSAISVPAAGSLPLPAPRFFAHEIHCMEAFSDRFHPYPNSGRIRPKRRLPWHMD